MSLLEDVFLEDEAGEAQDLERIIEGDEFDDRPRSRADDSDENSVKDDEAEEEKERVDPNNGKPKRVIRNPRFVLNPARLTGPRGIQVLPEHFKDFKFKGKGHEKSDLDLMLKKLEHWAYRLYPKFRFEDCLKKIETLGKKRAVAVHLTKLRLDMITSEETVIQEDSSDDEAQGPPASEEPDEFDKLLQQQIELARATPAPGSANKTPYAERASLMPKVTSSPSINDEQRERMLRNRQMAEERRLAKLKQRTSEENGIENNLTIENNHASVIHATSNVNAESSDESDVTKSNKNEIVELDDNDIVLTSNHVSKNHKRLDDRNLNIDIDDNDNAVVEIDNDHVTKSPRTYDSGKDIVEIDNDQVTKSPRTYDSGKDIVEIANDQVTKSPKTYDSGKDIVEIDNDQVTKSPKTYDSGKDIVEIDNDPVTRSLRTYVPAKKHNRSRIDSSDDDVSEPVIVGVENHRNDVERSKSNINNSIADKNDSSDDEYVNKVNTIDVENNRNCRSKKSNVIDSSDDDEPVVMNESITVEVYGSNKEDANNSNTYDKNSNKDTDSVFDTITNTENNNIVEISEDIELDSVKSNLQSANINNKSNSEMDKSNEVVKNCDENKLSQNENDELMDVDFGDEF